MKKYYVDFGGSTEIWAYSAEEAEKLFWDFINQDKPLPYNLYEIQNVEEKAD